MAFKTTVEAIEAIELYRSRSLIINGATKPNAIQKLVNIT
jgi:hypothetical protein